MVIPSKPLVLRPDLMNEHEEIPTKVFMSMSPARIASLTWNVGAAAVVSLGGYCKGELASIVSFAAFPFRSLLDRSHQVYSAPFTPIRCCPPNVGINVLGQRLVPGHLIPCSTANRTWFRAFPGFIVDAFGDVDFVPSVYTPAFIDTVAKRLNENGGKVPLCWTVTGYDGAIANPIASVSGSIRSKALGLIKSDLLFASISSVSVDLIDRIDVALVSLH